MRPRNAKKREMTEQPPQVLRCTTWDQTICLCLEVIRWNVNSRAICNFCRRHQLEAMGYHAGIHLGQDSLEPGDICGEAAAPKQKKRQATFGMSGMDHATAGKRRRSTLRYRRGVLPKDATKITFSTCT